MGFDGSREPTVCLRRRWAELGEMYCQKLDHLDCVFEGVELVTDLVENTVEWLYFLN